MINSISKAFKKAREEKRPALLTYTVAGDSTKNFFRNFKIDIKTCRYL